jgi:hypothetical protein
MIDEVVQVLTDLATHYDIAVDVPHHTSKGAPDPGNASRGRGASAMKDAGRLVFTLTAMSQEEAKLLGLSEIERCSLVRLDTGKVNITPKWHKAKWFRLVDVNIGNATELYPHGDQVQTVELWWPPDIFADLSITMTNDILNEIEAGLEDGSRFTDAPNATKRGAWRVVEKHSKKAEEACRHVIKRWLDIGLLVNRDYENPATRKPAIGLSVVNEKRPK